MRFPPILLALLIFASLRTPKLTAQTEDTAITIGSIDFFGYGGLDLKKMADNLPIHPGQTVTQATFEITRASVRKAIAAATGSSPTDVAAVCCDNNNRLMVYIGLSGSSSRPVPVKPVPHGREQLDPYALKLYDDSGRALEKAIMHGTSGEDRVEGYALSVDPATRMIQLKVRTYALAHAGEIETVLRHAGDAQQRVASAFMLGYAKRSRRQVQTLVDAVLDSDEQVRNNAVRALGVLFAAKNTPPGTIEAKPLIVLLHSGHWTDRNKASVLVESLTKRHNPDLVRQLRVEALAPLVEGARWTDPGHATAFLMILGRMANLPETEIARLIHGDKEKLIQAAMR